MIARRETAIVYQHRAKRSAYLARLDFADGYLRAAVEGQEAAARYASVARQYLFALISYPEDHP